MGYFFLEGFTFQATSSYGSAILGERPMHQASRGGPRRIPWGTL